MLLSSTYHHLASLLFAAGAMMMFADTNFLAATALEVGDTVCTVGYIMDYFCIERGTLFDNRSVKTLGPDGPIVHSVHCLIDVPSCVNSPFEILQDVSDGENEQYGRSFRVESNDLLIEYAKMVGSCNKGCTGSQKKGLKAAIVGEVINFGDSVTPALIKVTNIGNADAGCTAMEGGVGGKNMTMVGIDDVPNMVLNVGGSLNRIFIVHGVLMLIGWGLLLPSGAIIAKFLKHRPNALWFKIHRVCQMAGLIVALISFIIILLNSSALGDKGSGSLNYPHAVMGVVTMSLGLFQPLNAALRPHAPDSDEEKKTTARLIWEIVHKGLGWLAIILAAITIAFGTTLLSTETMQRNFQICYGAVIGALLVFLLIFTLLDKKS